MMDNNKHMPTFRVLSILECVSASTDGLSMTEIAEICSFPKSSISPILRTLTLEKYLFLKEGSGKYTLGLKAFEIGNRFPHQFSLLDQIDTIMHNIVDRCNETCHLAILDKGDVLYLNKVDSTEPIRMYSSVGKRLPAYATGLGKALLCSKTQSDLMELYPDGLVPFTSYTITNYQKLSDELLQIKNRGVAYDFQESSEHIQCVAVPIYDMNAQPVLGLSVAIPTFRAEPHLLEEAESLLTKAKADIEKVLAIAPFQAIG